MIDLHCHILPGVDDGPADLASSVEMCRQAAADGCTALVATPHQRHPSWPELDEGRYRPALQALLDAVGNLVELHLGAEIRVDAGFLGELEARDPSFVSLAGSRYLLLELERWGAAVEPEEVIHEARVAGWIPILAHPELLPVLAEDPDRVGDLVREGAKLQITASSVTGDFGREARRASWTFLDRGLVHFVASDAHSPSWRPPGLTEARRLLGSRLGQEVARRLTVDNPARVVRDRPLEEVASQAVAEEAGSP